MYLFLVFCSLLLRITNQFSFVVIMKAFQMMRDIEKHWQLPNIARATQILVTTRRPTFDVEGKGCICGSSAYTRLSETLSICEFKLPDR
jgi:hypothetical protein